MFKRFLLGSTVTLLTLIGTLNLAAAQPTNPFERPVSDCEGVTLLHRVTENMPWRLNLDAGAYRVVLWTPISDYDPTGLQIWGFGRDGLQERGYPI